MEEVIFKEQSSKRQTDDDIKSQGKEFRHLSCLCELESYETLMAVQKRISRAPLGRLCRSFHLDCRTHSIVTLDANICVCLREGRERGVSYLSQPQQKPKGDLYNGIRRRACWARISGEWQQLLLSSLWLTLTTTSVCCAALWGAIEKDDGLPVWVVCRALKA